MKSLYARLLTILMVFVIVASVALVALPQPGTASAGTLANDDVRGFSAAWSPDGELWAVWAAGSPTTDLFYSRWTGQDWLPARSLYSHPATWEEAPSLAFDADGVAWVAWSSSTEAEDILYLSRWTGQTWSSPQKVPAGDAVSNRQPSLAAAPGGGLWLAWVGFDGNDDEIYAVFWDGQAWSGPRRASGDDADPAAYDTQPRLAVGAGGDVWLAWTAYERFLDDEIYAARWDGKAWLPEEQVSADADAVAGAPSLAVAGDGTAWLAWQSTMPQAANHGRRVFVRSWQPAAGWQAEAMVSSSLESYVGEVEPSLVLDSAGRPHATWMAVGGTQGVGYAAFDGARWSTPLWGEQGAVAAAVSLAGARTPTGKGLPLLLWWPAGASGALPSITQLEDGTMPLLPTGQVPPEPPNHSIMVVPNRHLCFGDSITWGQYTDPATGQLVGDYPTRLSASLNGRVVPSDVVNDGVPSEKVIAGKWRLFDISWPTYQPQYIELLEGTNDLTHDRPYNDIADDLSLMVKYTKQAGSLVFLSTLLPRDDTRNKKIEPMNGYIADVAAYRGVPLVDNWQAFINSGDWYGLLVDALHPNGTGMQLLSDTWYAAILANTSLVEDTVPPTTWVEPLPASSACGSVAVQWNGIDNVSWVADYDVQVQIGGGLWNDWLLATPDTSGAYAGGTHGDILSFRVRGRDIVGNQSNYGVSQSTTIVDLVPPYGVKMGDLPIVQKAPVLLTWEGYDACSAVTFDVQCSIGSTSNWQTWLSDVPYTSAVFDPEAAPCGPAQYGEVYYFRTIAFDQAGQAATSGHVHTVMARYTLAGRAYNVQHQPVSGATVAVTGDVLAIERRPAGYLAYLPAGGDYDVSMSRSGFGILPAIQDFPVVADVDDLDLVLPPQDDVVSDGGFEAGVWGDWLAAGDVLPTLTTGGYTTGGHTGNGVALVGGAGGLSRLSQPLTVPAGLSDPTLSFLVRLEDGTGDDSNLQVSLEGTSISHSQVVSSDEWTHVWLPVDEAAGASSVLTFSISDDAVVRLDEVSLGSAHSGGVLIDLPIVLRATE